MLKRIAGPAFISNSAANVYTPPNAAVFVRIQHIHIHNKTAGAVTFSLYVGATGGSASGTELEKDRSVDPNKDFDLYFSPGLRMDSTDFLSAIAASASSLVITVMGEYVAV